MHELSIAEGIVDIIGQYVAVERLQDVRSVRMHVGIFSGAVPESLLFSYQAITAGSPLERSSIELERIPSPKVFDRFCTSTNGIPEWCEWLRSRTIKHAV